MFTVTSGKLEKAKKVVIYGPEGIGKSSLAAQFPNPIFIDTEGSTTELDVKRLPAPTSWQMINQQVDWVKQQGSSQFGTLVIDTIDWAEMKCNESVCAAHGKTGIENFGYGQGYVYAAEEFGRFLNKLSDVIDAGIHVVLNAHSHVVKFDQPDEMGSYDRYQLKLGQKTGSRTAALVKEWADMVLFINYKTFSVAVDEKGKKHKAQGGTRTMYTTHHPAWDAKNRHGLPPELPLDYSHIAHIFSSQPAVQQQQPATNTNATTQQQAPTQPPADADPAPTQQQPPATTNDIPAVGTDPEPELNPAIPKALRDLMLQHNVTEVDIQAVVSQRGYYPLDTPITNYDPTFIDGVLVAAWDQVHGMIKEFKANLPF